MRQLFSLGLAVALWGTFSAGRAHAIPIIHGSGYTITHLADLPPQAARPLAADAKKKNPLLQQNKLGFRYWRFHLFWADVWTSEGEFVAYSTGNPFPAHLGKDAAAVAKVLGLPEDKVYTPLLYTFPLGWWIAGGFVVFLLVTTALDKNKPRPAEESPAQMPAQMPSQLPFAEEQLLNDPRYQQALVEMNPRGAPLDQLSMTDIQRGIDSHRPAGAARRGREQPGPAAGVRARPAGRRRAAGSERADELSVAGRATQARSASAGMEWR